MLKKGRVIVVSSVSGGGKTSLLTKLGRYHPELHVAITATSRKPRSNEIPDVHYHFYTKEEFQQKIKNNEFLEHAEVHGNFYGVLAAPLFEKIERGESVILNIDVQGKRQVKEKLGDQVLSIFILPPGREVWEARLRNRGTDPEEEISRRLKEGIREMKEASAYDYQIVNEVLEVAAGELSAILKEEGLL